MSNITIIHTKYKTNASGRSQVLAKGGGKQRTVNWDASRSTDWNHGNAAGTLALVLDLKWREGISHRQNDAGTEHMFEV